MARCTGGHGECEGQEKPPVPATIWPSDGCPAPTEQTLMEDRRTVFLRHLTAAPWHAFLKWQGLWPGFSVTAISWVGLTDSLYPMA